MAFKLDKLAEVMTDKEMDDLKLSLNDTSCVSFSFASLFMQLLGESLSEFYRCLLGEGGTTTSS